MQQSEIRPHYVLYRRDNAPRNTVELDLHVAAMCRLKGDHATAAACVEGAKDGRRKMKARRERY